MERIAVVPVALAVIATCIWYLQAVGDREEIPTERSTAHYTCRRCGRDVCRGTMLRYIYERMLCDRCWLDDGARLGPADSSLRTRRYPAIARITNPLVMLSISRGGTLILFLNRRRA